MRAQPRAAERKRPRPLRLLAPVESGPAALLPSVRGAARAAQGRRACTCQTGTVESPECGLSCPRFPCFARSKLEPAEKAKLNLMLAYAADSLFYIFLKTQVTVVAGLCGVSCCRALPSAS